jgi:hypothetical protein
MVSFIDILAGMPAPQIHVDPAAWRRQPAGRRLKCGSNRASDWIPLHDEDQALIQEIAVWLLSHRKRINVSLVLKTVLRAAKTGPELLAAYDEASNWTPGCPTKRRTHMRHDDDSRHTMQARLTQQTPPLSPPHLRASEMTVQEIAQLVSDLNRLLAVVQKAVEDGKTGLPAIDIDD